MNAKVAKAQAKPQPCFTTDEVELILANTYGEERIVFATLAYEGLRVGELEQLQWGDVNLASGNLGMLHICRGGSTPGKTKSKRDRFVPIHPRVRPMLEALPRPRNGEPLVFPGVTERQFLKRLKEVCKNIGLVNAQIYKLHSFRHHFASMCANHQVAYKKALAWLGHRSSDILDLYYHLNDAESQSAMASLAGDTFPTLPAEDEETETVDSLAPTSGGGGEGNLRAKAESEIEKLPEDQWEQELLAVLDCEAERAGLDQARIYKLIKPLYLRSKTFDGSDFDSLHSLLSSHDFLPS